MKPLLNFMCYNDFRSRAHVPRRSERIINKNIKLLQIKSEIGVEVIKLNIRV